MSNKFGAPINDEAVLPSGGLSPADLLGNLASNGAGFLSTKPLTKYVTGPRTIIKVNGKLAGFAFGVSWRIDTAQDEIWAIDNYVAYELAPKRITVEGTLSMFHIPGQSADAKLIQANVLSFMFHRYISIEIKDRQTDALLFQTNKAVITSAYEDVKAESMATINLSWKAIGWANEMIPSYPSHIDDIQINDSDATSWLGAIAGAISSL